MGIHNVAAPIPADNPALPLGYAARSSSAWFRILTAEQLARRLRPRQLRAVWQLLPPSLRTVELPASQHGPARAYRQSDIAAAMWFLDLRWARELLQGGETARATLWHFKQRYFRKGLYGARRPFLRPAVEARAHEQASTPRTVLEHAVFENLRHALAQSDGTEALSTFRYRFNELVTADFLGAGWRRRCELPASDQQLVEVQGSAWRTDPPDPEAEVTLRLEVEGVLARVSLSPREAELVAALRVGYSLAEWARREGVAASTVRNLLARVRRKVRALM